ncbi:MAG: DUF86 domain-containing protein [Candidatus Levybacteria bacterium]|nr:DUF86 domain-containing protein [Candidatus Levybacteria bacterium]
MAIDKELLSKKLSFLKEQISKIDNMNFSETELEENKDIQDLLTFRLQQAVETSIDISTHIIASLNLKRQETSRDAFSLLGQEKIIGKDLAGKMGQAADFRNRVVHGYNNFDFSILFKDYKEDLGDLKNFGVQILAFLEKNTIKSK